jgi:hypothetical protein
MVLSIPVFLLFRASFSDIVPIAFTGDCSFNFNLYLEGLGIIRTTFDNNGYRTSVRVGSYSDTLTNMQSKNCSGVVVSTHLTQLSVNAVLIAFKFVNHNSDSQIVDLAVWSDAYLYNTDSPPFETVAGRGFVTWSDPYRLTIVCLDYPLVSSVTTYWFGSQSQGKDMCWSQTSESSVYDTDSAMAFSWQGISLSPNESKTVSVIMKSDVFDSNSPILTIPAEAIPDICVLTQMLHINGSVLKTGSSVLMTIILVINSDCSQIYTLESELENESFFGVNISLEVYGLSLGTCELTFYAVDNSGCVSSGVNFTTEIVPEATISSSPSITATDSVSQSPSATCSISLRQSVRATVTPMVDSSDANKSNSSAVGGVIGGVFGGVIVLAIVACVLMLKVFRKGPWNEQDDLAEALRSEERLSQTEWSGAVTGKSFMILEKSDA